MQHSRQLGFDPRSRVRTPIAVPFGYQAPGRDVIEGYCGACHSLDYIRMNSPFLGATHWDAEVAKMIKAFGAPIDPADAKIIGDYLKEN